MTREKIAKINKSADEIQATARQRLEQVKKLEYRNKQLEAWFNWLEGRLAAHEGGAPAVELYYDDATFQVCISQRKGFGTSASTEQLGWGHGLKGAIVQAIENENEKAQAK